MQKTPYTIEMNLPGTRPILFHKYDAVSISEQDGNKRKKGEKVKDNPDIYCYRSEEGKLGIPGINFHSAIIAAAKFRSDPRSPRASAKDLFKCGVIPFSEFSEFEGDLTQYHWEDYRRVRVQNSYITRVRPGLSKGWRISFQLEVSLPEYIQPDFLLDVAADAGRYVGLCDFRPQFGRFLVESHKIL